MKTFEENKEDITLLWRPHPLIPATINSMRPQLKNEYEKIVDEYKKDGWGIYDDTTDNDRAMLIMVIGVQWLRCIRKQGNR